MTESIWAVRADVTRESVDRAEDASIPWNIWARACLEWLACTRREFTSDAFWAAMDRSGLGRPGEPRASGGPFVYARNRSWIVKTGQVVQSRRPLTADGRVHHTAPIPVYRSLIYGERPTLGFRL